MLSIFLDIFIYKGNKHIYLSEFIFPKIQTQISVNVIFISRFFWCKHLSGLSCVCLHFVKDMSYYTDTTNVMRWCECCFRRYEHIFLICFSFFGSLLMEKDQIGKIRKRIYQQLLPLKGK